MSFRNSKKLFFLLIFCALMFGAGVAYSQEFTSDSFKSLNPVINSGSYGTSDSFKLFGSITEISVGTSTASSFKVNAGFLYFPFVTTPVVSATAGDSKVDLSWTSASAGVGWSVSSYSVGQSTTSGGPYTNTDVGNVLSSSRTGLTNGTTYYFVVRVIDGVGNSIATSTQVSATPVAPTPPPSGGGGGGGGGGAIISAGTGSVVFTGRAYPKSTVTLLKDAQVAASTIAGPDSNFTITLSNLSAGNFIFSVYGEDKDGLRSSLFTFSVSVTAGVTTNVGGIFIAPTIAVDKSEVRRGDNIAIFGQAAHLADIVISVNSEEEFFGKTISDKDGVYLYNFDTSLVDYGTHSTKSKAAIGNQLVSSWSQLINFKVGTKNVAAPKIVAKKCPAKGDVNNDCKVNLIDFSIVAYWYNRKNPPAKVDFNGDGKVNLVDFSILAYYWTG